MEIIMKHWYNLNGFKVECIHLVKHKVYMQKRLQTVCYSGVYCSFVGWLHLYEVSILKYYSSGILPLGVDLATDLSQGTRTDADPGVPWKNGLDPRKDGNREAALVLGEFCSKMVLFAHNTQI